MRNSFIGIICTALILFSMPAVAHEGDHPPDLRIWKDVDGLFELEASFILQRDQQVHLRKHDGSLVWVPIERLSRSDRAWVIDRTRMIDQLNHPSIPTITESTFDPMLPFLIIVLLPIIVRYGWGWMNRRLLMRSPTIILLMFGLALAATAQPDRPKPQIQSHFEPFRDQLKFRSDERWFYVESKGMPDHPMMIGITAWQQQVPIPQAYTGANAWQIPLFPKFAEKPISAKQNLFRGAIALAVNGVPIFNPIKNDGRTDTFLAGELDEYGGHCGRADDYHYHIAPIHLEKIVGKGNPIAYALDGFPIYGYTDANGKEPTDLDAFNGRMEPAGYRYYSTKKYPYINGGMRGVVIVKDDQIDPQPKASSPRPSLPPLRGAKITGFDRDDATKTIRVQYDLRGATHSVRYTANLDGSYRFTFTDGAGKQTSETYRGRADQKKDPMKKGGGKKKGDANPQDANAPRQPWLAAHFDELDTDRDGVLTLDELKREIDRTFTAYDVNRDGTLSKAEYTTNTVPVRSALAGFVKGHATDFAASNGDISREALRSEVLRMFERADRQGAGKLRRADLIPTANQSTK